MSIPGDEARDPGRRARRKRHRTQNLGNITETTGVLFETEEEQRKREERQRRVATYVQSTTITTGRASAGFDGPGNHWLADNECKHGRLPGDRTDPCGCWPGDADRLVRLASSPQRSHDPSPNPGQEPGEEQAA